MILIRRKNKKEESNKRGKRRERICRKKGESKHTQEFPHMWVASRQNHRYTKELISSIPELMISFSAQREEKRREGRGRGYLRASLRNGRP